MNLRHLHTFVSVAEAGGFSKALGRLHLSQPAASRQILALEAELGLALFDRVGRGLRLTSAGDDLLRQSREILAQTDALRQRAQALHRGDAGVLRVGATPQTIENSLAEFAQSYRRRFPDVDVQFIEDGAARLPNRLLHGDMDLAVVVAGDERLAGRLLYPTHCFAVVPIRHRWSRLPVLDVSELAGERLMVGSGFGSTALVQAACEAAHVKPKIVLESAAPHTIVALVRAGFGIGMLPSAAVKALNGVRAVPLVHRGASIGAWIMIAWNGQRFLPPYPDRFAHEFARGLRKDFPACRLIRRAPSLPKPEAAEHDA